MPVLILLIVISIIFYISGFTPGTGIVPRINVSEICNFLEGKEGDDCNSFVKPCLQTASINDNSIYFCLASTFALTNVNTSRKICSKAIDHDTEKLCLAIATQRISYEEAISNCNLISNEEAKIMCKAIILRDSNKIEDALKECEKISSADPMYNCKSNIYFGRDVQKSKEFCEKIVDTNLRNKCIQINVKPVT